MKTTPELTFMNCFRIRPRRASAAPHGAKAKAAKIKGLLFLSGVLLLVGCASDPASNPVERTYARGGPYATATTTREVTNVSGKKVTYKLYYPRNYTSLGFKSPIVTWGNGTGGTPDMYSTLLRHFASYGFTVVAPDLKNTGSGKDIGEAARYMVSQNSDSTPGNDFHDNLDVKQVAAVGHSQGAGGAVGAALKNPAVVRTVMTFSLPDKKWASKNPDCPTIDHCKHDVATLRQPVFFISTRGYWDAVIFGGIAPPATGRAYLNSVQGPAALGIVSLSEGTIADHSSIQDKAHRGHPGGMIGYATAWLEYRLRGNATAAQAFTGAKPEIVTNSNWNGSAVK